MKFHPQRKFQFEYMVSISFCAYESYIVQRGITGSMSAQAEQFDWMNRISTAVEKCVN